MIQHKLFSIVTIFAVVGMALLAPAGAEEQPNKQAAQLDGKERTAMTTGSTLIYKPPVRGAPGGRVGGGTRGSGQRGPDHTFVLSVLAPNHPGLTVEDQPVLYWYLTRPISTPIEFTLTDEGTKPLVSTTLNPPFQAGLQRVRLADYGVHLSLGTQYLWHVAVVMDPKRRARDILAGATLERVPLPPEIAAKLSQGEKSQAPQFYAASGLWYDAVAAISTLIEATPEDMNLRKQRASLLQQVGLQEVADYDLKQGAAN